ncbi:putative dolichyl pyrophosphate Man9GlcNAc2 alpha-1,3-glucosyltransferase [Orchesella cincta]|uniref:Alpha-1,3-glucosyltransferase n=1 Tax=Orchesella cincta TaxID=48709 RepID=A0A1D2MGN7_ORCCI|nr:putative dolichyl pyrophosphate Man9GlcNAc2 alpha-1,3-glucosyltransferase [Orchesella cincta]
MGISRATITSCLALALFLRWGVSLFPYSGEGKPPMFGDFEAQRHWMEITVNLPLHHWYFNSTLNNLDYWGLDYPPLSAYHSYGLGKMFAKLLPSSVKFGTSRGFESPLLKFLMRFSVSASDLLLPALIVFFSVFKKLKGQHAFPSWLYITLALSAPPFILVDYGHFQYNCVSLGLTVWAVICLFTENISLGAVAFTLAVNHKQMSLYHSLAFFAYMTSTLVLKRADLLTTFRVGTMIISTLGLLWLPFGDYWIYVLGRVFPLKRGVFEDKVGTFWYALDRVTPIKGVYDDTEVAQLCAIVTIVSVLPSAINLFLRSGNPKLPQDDLLKTFLLCMFNTSLNCFLFSYHVHEKSIMLPCLAAVLLTPWYPKEMIWFITISSLSLYPLFHQEQSHIALLCVTSFFVLVAQQGKIITMNGIRSLYGILFLASVGGYLFLISGLHFITPPGKLPHLFPALIALYSFLHFIVFSAWFHYNQLTDGRTRAVKATPAQQGRKSTKKSQ